MRLLRFSLDILQERRCSCSGHHVVQSSQEVSNAQKVHHCLGKGGLLCHSARLPHPRDADGVGGGVDLLDPVENGGLLTSTYREDPLHHVQPDIGELESQLGR